MQQSYVDLRLSGGEQKRGAVGLLVVLDLKRQAPMALAPPAHTAVCELVSAVTS